MSTPTPSTTTTTSTTTTSTTSNSISWLERGWLGYHAFVHTGVGLANAIAPFEIMQTRIERNGGGSLQTLFASAMKEVESAERSPLSAPSPTQPPPSSSSSSPYAAAVGNLATSSTPNIDRIAVAKENLDTLAALVASALFQVQYSTATDALIAYLAVSGLRTDSLAERRLIHRALGYTKATQYLIYVWHEVTTSGYLSAFNVIGLGVTVAATYTWGFVRAPAKKSVAAIAKKDDSTATTETDKKGASPY
ncbi:hypothetical protein HDU79_009680 [Rhizoclosmatium sp. JEL0117]|nr:hypothetical protein HDU79_009680 [Rhizoclosmatium sp. JEL0117]